MDSPRFDSLVRSVQEAGTRRGALRAALGGATAAAVLAVSRGDAGAKKKCKKKKCPKCEALLVGQPCTTNLQCCTNETNNLCAISQGATEQVKTCCGAEGNSCTTDADCCAPVACDNGICGGPA